MYQTNPNDDAYGRAKKSTNKNTLNGDVLVGPNKTIPSFEMKKLRNQENGSQKPKNENDYSYDSNYEEKNYLEDTRRISGNGNKGSKSLPKNEVRYTKNGIPYTYAEAEPNNKYSESKNVKKTKPSQSNSHKKNPNDQDSEDSNEYDQQHKNQKMPSQDDFHNQQRASNPDQYIKNGRVSNAEEFKRKAKPSKTNNRCETTSDDDDEEYPDKLLNQQGRHQSSFNPKKPSDRIKEQSIGDKNQHKNPKLNSLQEIYDYKRTNSQKLTNKMNEKQAGKNKRKKSTNAPSTFSFGHGNEIGDTTFDNNMDSQPRKSNKEERVRGKMTDQSSGRYLDELMPKDSRNENYRINNFDYQDPTSQNLKQRSGNNHRPSDNDNGRIKSMNYGNPNFDEYENYDHRISNNDKGKIKSTDYGNSKTSNFKNGSIYDPRISNNENKKINNFDYNDPNVPNEVIFPRISNDQNGKIQNTSYTIPSYNGQPNYTQRVNNNDTGKIKNFNFKDPGNNDNENYNQRISNNQNGKMNNFDYSNPTFNNKLSNKNHQIDPDEIKTQFSKDRNSSAKSLPNSKLMKDYLIDSGRVFPEDDPKSSYISDSYEEESLGIKSSQMIKEGSFNEKTKTNFVNPQTGQSKTKKDASFGKRNTIDEYIEFGQQNFDPANPKYPNNDISKNLSFKKSVDDDFKNNQFTKYDKSVQLSKRQNLIPMKNEKSPETKQTDNYNKKTLNEKYPEFYDPNEKQTDLILSGKRNSNNNSRNQSRQKNANEIQKEENPRQSRSRNQKSNDDKELSNPHKKSTYQRSFYQNEPTDSKLENPSLKETIKNEQESQNQFPREKSINKNTSNEFNKTKNKPQFDQGMQSSLVLGKTSSINVNLKTSEQQTGKEIYPRSSSNQNNKKDSPKISTNANDLEFFDDAENQKPKTSVNLINKNLDPQTKGSFQNLRHPSRFPSETQNFFKRLTINEIENVAKTLSSSTVDNLDVLEDFIQKNRISGFIGKVLYNYEDEEFILKFKEDVLDQPSAFSKFKFIDSEDMIYKKFKVYPLEHYRKIDADQIERKGKFMSKGVKT